ncbi:hypothetical protein NDU88_002196 [Pleurodeles waltl]|uniref:Uncharacterized protein n=1 Tax=Pleurodeles waltl TaxID=8319 RepID=A0AAV7TK35_PLEWA|nr:hypothetical protein NDU88_002196 [Pleurodeles waltl]
MHVPEARKPDNGIPRNDICMMLGKESKGKVAIYELQRLAGQPGGLPWQLQIEWETQCCFTPTTMLGRGRGKPPTSFRKDERREDGEVSGNFPNQLQPFTEKLLGKRRKEVGAPAALASPLLYCPRLQAVSTEPYTASRALITQQADCRLSSSPPPHPAPSQNGLDSGPGGLFMGLRACGPKTGVRA